MNVPFSIPFHIPWYLLLLSSLQGRFESSHLNSSECRKLSLQGINGDFLNLRLLFIHYLMLRSAPVSDAEKLLHYTDGSPRPSRERSPAFAMRMLCCSPSWRGEVGCLVPAPSTYSHIIQSTPGLVPPPRALPQTKDGAGLGGSLLAKASHLMCFNIHFCGGHKES